MNQVVESSKPWLTEPNQAQFEFFGFKCEIHRVPGLGHLCGYVAIPKGHPWYEKSENDISARVHGGLTYSGFGCGLAPRTNNDTFFIGFDCAHSGDLAPEADSLTKGLLGGEYRTIEYVKGQCEALAAQVAAVANAAS